MRTSLGMYPSSSCNNPVVQRHLVPALSDIAISEFIFRHKLLLIFQVTLKIPWYIRNISEQGDRLTRVGFGRVFPRQTRQVDGSHHTIRSVDLELHLYISSARCRSFFLTIDCRHLPHLDLPQIHQTMSEIKEYISSWTDTRWIKNSSSISPSTISMRYEVLWGFKSPFTYSSPRGFAKLPSSGQWKSALSPFSKILFPVQCRPSVSSYSGCCGTNPTFFQQLEIDLVVSWIF